MYIFLSCRQAHQHRQLRLNAISLLELLSTSWPWWEPAGLCPTLCSPRPEKSASYSRTAENLTSGLEYGGRTDSVLSWGQSEGPKDKEGERDDEARGTAVGPGRYSLGGAGPGVDVGAGATSSVLSQFSCARGPCPGAGPGVVV